MGNPNKNRALFLDRDGIINHMVPYSGDELYDSPRNAKDVRLIDGVAKLIHWANSSNIPVVVITNQPGIAKGKLTKKAALEIKNSINLLLKENDAKIDAIYECLHHPHAKILKYKTICDCRKPMPGLLLKASSDLKINLNKSIFLGDTKTDVDAGKKANCKTMIMLHKENTPDKVLESAKAESDFKVNNMEEAYTQIVNFFK